MSTASRLGTDGEARGDMRTDGTGNGTGTSQPTASVAAEFTNDNPHTTSGAGAGVGVDGLDMDKLRTMLDHVTQLQDSDPCGGGDPSSSSKSAAQLLRSCVEAMWRQPGSTLRQEHGSSKRLDSLVTDAEILSLPLDRRAGRHLNDGMMSGLRWKCDLIGRGGQTFDFALALLQTAAVAARNDGTHDEFIFQMEARLLCERDRHWLVKRYLRAAARTAAKPRVRPLVQVFPRVCVTSSSLRTQQQPTGESTCRERITQAIDGWYAEIATTEDSDEPWHVRRSRNYAWAHHIMDLEEEEERLQAQACDDAGYAGNSDAALRIGPPVIGLIPVQQQAAQQRQQQEYSATTPSRMTGRERNCNVVALAASDRALYELRADGAVNVVVSAVARPMQAVAASRDGTRVAAAMYGGMYVVWDTRDRSVACTFLLPGHRTRVLQDMALSADGKTLTLLLVTPGCHRSRREGVVEVDLWDVSGKINHQSNGPGRTAAAAAAAATENNNVNGKAAWMSRVQVACDASQMSTMLIVGTGGAAGSIGQAGVAQCGIATGDKLGIVGMADVTSGEYRINLSHIGFVPILAAASDTAATTTAANARAVTHAGGEDVGAGPVGQRVVWAGRSRMAVTEVCGTNMVIRRRIRFDATAVAMSSDGLLVAAAGRDGMVRVWDMVKVPTRCGDSGAGYGNATYMTSSMMMSGVGEGGDGNDNYNSNDDGDDNGPPPRVVSCGGGIHTGMGFGGGFGGGRMNETTTTTAPLLGCARLCITANADADLWSATSTVMLGRSRGSGMVIAIGMDGIRHMIAHGVHMGDAATDETNRTGLARARHGACVQCVALTRNASVVMSAAADGSLIAWPVRARKKGIASVASGGSEHRQPGVEDENEGNEDKDEEYDDDVQGGCEGGMLDVKEGAHEGGVSLIVPWGFDFVTTYGATDGTAATWVVRPHGIELVQRVRTAADRQTRKARMKANVKKKESKSKARTKKRTCEHQGDEATPERDGPTKNANKVETKRTQQDGIDSSRRHGTSRGLAPNESWLKDAEKQGGRGEEEQAARQGQSAQQQPPPQPQKQKDRAVNGDNIGQGAACRSIGGVGGTVVGGDGDVHGELAGVDTDANDQGQGAAFDNFVETKKKSVAATQKMQLANLTDDAAHSARPHQNEGATLMRLTATQAVATEAAEAAISALRIPSSLLPPATSPTATKTATSPWNTQPQASVGGLRPGGLRPVGLRPEPRAQFLGAGLGLRPGPSGLRDSEYSHRHPRDGDGDGKANGSDNACGASSLTLTLTDNQHNDGRHSPPSYSSSSSSSSSASHSSSPSPAPPSCNSNGCNNDDGDDDQQVGMANRWCAASHNAAVQSEHVGAERRAKARACVACDGGHLVDRRNGRIVATLPARVAAAAAWCVSDDGALLVAGLANGQVVWFRIES